MSNEYLFITLQLNVLHWHITDSQSFPIQLEKYPESTAKMAPAGSYHQSRRYSVDDAKEIVEYANFRGKSPRISKANIIH